MFYITIRLRIRATGAALASLPAPSAIVLGWAATAGPIRLRNVNSVVSTCIRTLRDPWRNPRDWTPVTRPSVTLSTCARSVSAWDIIVVSGTTTTSNLKTWNHGDQFVSSFIIALQTLFGSYSCIPFNRMSLAAELIEVKQLLTDRNPTRPLTLLGYRM